MSLTVPHVHFVTSGAIYRAITSACFHQIVCIWSSESRTELIIAELQYGSVSLRLITKASFDRGKKFVYYKTALSSSICSGSTRLRLSSSHVFVYYILLIALALTEHPEFDMKSVDIIVV